jgi:hypothetical protein
VYATKQSSDYQPRTPLILLLTSAKPISITQNAKPRAKITQHLGRMNE